VNLEHERAAGPATVVHRLVSRRASRTVRVPGAEQRLTSRRRHRRPRDRDQGRHSRRCARCDGRTGGPGVLPGRAGPQGRGRHVRGLATRDKDPRKSLHVEEGADPGAEAGNYNTIWTSNFESVSTFGSSSATAGSPTYPSGTTCRLTRLPVHGADERLSSEQRDACRPSRRARVGSLARDRPGTGRLSSRARS
jgi:hypothetical protein